MKKFIFSVTSVPLLLIACTKAGPKITLEDHLKNPLYSEQYHDMLLDQLVELEIQKDPLLEKSRMQAYVDEMQKQALAKAKEATKIQNEGTMGTFIRVREDSHGEALYMQNTLFLGPTFEVIPGPSLHVYLTTVVDPRDVPFPDETSIDLGKLESAFGAQEMSVPAMENPLLMRTVVLYDTKLERIFGFAQLAK